MSLGVTEMLGLRRYRVNLTAGHLYCDGETLRPWHLMVCEAIYCGKSGGTKNAIRRRQVPLPDSAVAMLEDWMSRAKFTGPQDFVFCAENGKPLSETNLASRQLRPTGRAIGIPLSWRMFRRTATTLAEAHGLPLSDRMAMMGHSRPAMTLHYTTADPERHRIGMESIMRAILQPVGISARGPVATAP